MFGRQESPDDGRGSVVGKVGDDLIGCARGHQGVYINFPGIGYNDSDVGTVLEPIGLFGGQGVVKLDGNDICTPLGQLGRQDASSRTDLDNLVALLNIGGADYTAEDPSINEKMLSQGFFRRRMAAAD